MRVGTVVISGMHSGPNPSPGLGVARSLRLSRPDLRLVGLDYSPNSSGLHSDVLDGMVRLPPWSEIHVGTWVEQIAQVLEPDDTVLIPCLDLEVRLLASAFGPHDRVLSPTKAALDIVRKPPVDAARQLGMASSEYETDTSWSTVDQFIRRSPHGVWVKGQHYEAFRAYGALNALALGDAIEQTWGGGWHLEAHVPGQECGIAFCAVNGRLLDAVFMTKAMLTAEGKTWAGEISELDGTLRTRLAELVTDNLWTGGGELELIRSWDGELTLMEINPRLPAWIHGASVCGANLPAALVELRAADPDRHLSPGFTRVVEEISVHPLLGLPPFAWAPDESQRLASKHPSGMPLLGQRRLIPKMQTDLDEAEQADCQTAAATSPGGFEHLLEPPGNASTPFRRILLSLFTEQVQALQVQVQGLGQVVLAHSMKTCSQPAVLIEAARLGMIAEAISLAELETADRLGLPADQAILNGPAKWWPARDRVRCWAFFADSVAELRKLHLMLDDGFDLSADIVGIRVAPISVPSRFGIPLHDAKVMAETARLLDSLSSRLGARWGLHFHYAQSNLGAQRWERECSAALKAADPLADLLGHAPAILDVGGGWDVDDTSLIGASLEYVLAHGPSTARNDAPLLVLEPGKLLTQPTAAVVTQVLSRTGSGAGGDVVVDAALGDIPEGPHRPHPVARFDGRHWIPLSPGRDRVLGRSCMEADVLAQQLDLTQVGDEDYLAFGMCGAYDTSMAYGFGLGNAPRQLGRP